MTLRDAYQTVIDLAVENELSEADAQLDACVLESVRADQQEAFKVLGAFMRTLFVGES